MWKPKIKSLIHPAKYVIELNWIKWNWIERKRKKIYVCIGNTYCPTILSHTLMYVWNCIPFGHSSCCTDPCEI